MWSGYFGHKNAQSTAAVNHYLYREKRKRKSPTQNSKAHVVMVSLNCQKIEVKMAEAALENGVFCCIKYFLISFEVVNIYQGQYPPPH